MPAEPAPNNLLSCFKAQKFGILYQTQFLRFLYCNHLKRKVLIFYCIDDASCILRCCVLIYTSIALYYFSINLLVVYRESVNPIGYITRRLSADSLQL